jgi:hypothetical protein
MRKVTLMFALAVLSAGWLERNVHAQEAGENNQEKPTAEKTGNADQRARTPVQPFRLDFSFYEMEDGKKINTRHYSLDLTANSRNQLRIGTRVPVPLGNDGLQFEYMDVGTKIWAFLAVESGGDLRLDVNSDISNLDAAQSPGHNPSAHPVVRQIQINGSTLLITGKPMLIGSVDDPNSTRQFQLEVTATKLR